MKKSEFTNMRKEIQKRIESNAWNFRIAAGVLEKKNKIKKRIIYSSSISSLAIAALFIIIFLFGIKTGPEINPYDQFIVKQIDGTSDAAGLIQDDIDMVIANTLAMR